jgi:hypothetical protein
MKKYQLFGTLKSTGEQVPLVEGFFENEAAAFDGLAGRVQHFNSDRAVIGTCIIWVKEFAALVVSEVK